MSNKKILLSAFDTWQERLEVDSDDERKGIVHTREDLRPIMRQAKVFSEEPPGKDMRLVALIPNFVLDKAFREGWLNDKQKWKDWFNDDANAAFRVWGKRL